MTAAPRILYYVQHLLGVGHVFRTMRIVAALMHCGFDVRVVYGGEKLPQFDGAGARVHFLPSLVSRQGDFSTLLARDGQPADDAYKEERRDRLLAILSETAPDIVVTEAFPFGRRQMHFELLPMMDAVRQLPKRPLVFSSIRDILQEGNKPAKDRQTVEFVRRYFDGVLVHGDPDLVRLDATFPFTAEIADRVCYTGIVTPPTSGAVSDSFDVVVSAGGGLLGRELVFAAAGARPRSALRDARWCILTGPYLTQSDYDDLQGIAGSVTLMRFLPDLHHTLAGATLSISLAGYNTVADIMVAGCRAIVAPQWNDKETEQLRRAQLLSRRGLVEMIGHAEKDSDTLVAAIDRVMVRPRPDWSAIRKDGAATTARVLRRALDGDDLSAFR